MRSVKLVASRWEIVCKVDNKKPLILKAPLGYFLPCVALRNQWEALKEGFF